MKKLLFFLLILLLSSFTFSEPVPLIKYYDESVNSHACVPSAGMCTYQKVVNVDSNYVSDSVNGLKVLGVSDLTNAHVEINNNSIYTNNNNYSNEIFMIDNIFSSGLCEYTLRGNSCSSGKVCAFGVSDETNAHISTCNTFSSEIKFCCKPEVFSGVVQSSGIPNNCNIYSFEINNKTIDSNVFVSFSCIENTDANLLFYDSLGNILNGPTNVSCGLESSNYNNFKVENSQVIGVKLYTNMCSVEKFVNISKATEQVSIPDNNFLVILVLLSLVVFFVKRKS